MKVFVTGAAGQLGRAVADEFAKRKDAVTASDVVPPFSSADGIDGIALDITDGAAVSGIIRSVSPDVIVHCAAWTAVDAAELPENRAKVDAINRDGTCNIAKAAAECGAKMIYISTDYVFGGSGTRPWKPDGDGFAPRNYYGESKLAGENAVRSLLEKYFIIRTSWVFGPGGNNFVRTMIRAGKTHSSVRVVDDQIGTPTYTRDLARLLADMARTEKYGVYHATNEGGYISWYGFCAEIYRLYGLGTAVIPVSTEEYGMSVADRPRNSRLDKSKLERCGFIPLPDWRDALSRYLEEEDL
jgi:dTDP-4-dehydrorhamnose reductase